MYTRLQREPPVPFLASVIRSFVLCLIIAAPGAIVGYMILTRQPGYDLARLRWPDPHLFPVIIGALSIALSALMFLGFINDAIASRSPGTVIEIDPSPLRAGGTVRLRVLQPGPINIGSIRVTLFGEKRAPWKVIGDQRVFLAKRHGPHLMMEIDRQKLGAGETLEREAAFTVPANVESSTWVAWRIEVCRKVAWRSDSIDRLPVTVEPLVSDEAIKLTP